MEDVARILTDLALIDGHSLRSVEKKDYSWFFAFTGGTIVQTESEWRLLAGDRIAVTSEDHEQSFGLPRPVDASERVLSVVGSSVVSNARIDEITGDLCVFFGNKVALQFLQLSSGYESWRLGVNGNHHICLGGGEIASFKEPTRKTQEDPHAHP